MTVQPSLRRRVIAGALLLLLPALALSADVEQNGARFSKQIQLDDETLDLSGTGVAKYRIVITVYAAGLYLPADTKTDQVLSGDTPRILAIEYFHDISASDIIKAARTKLKEQLSSSELDRLEPKIKQFHSMYQAVSDGDRYRMDYVPGMGTQLLFNGKPVGTVEGADFAAAYFGIWLDADDPLSKNLRRDLLAGAD
ncbi:chalcone isomerase family protein [Spiribacter onubensis]|uniref:Chalcone isomerase family protein n=1 Tax=Spiribacter onubensis TaxID=3122420 RepID=A0ABV3S686_9GAMM